MNIFFLEHRGTNETIQDYAARVAASHCDLHQKQILETWQMLNTNCNVLGIETDNASVAYQNHPSTKWVRASLANWQFAYHLAEQLALEFKRRGNKKELHKSFTRIRNNIPYSLSEVTGGELTQFPTAMPDNIASVSECPVEAYRHYYNTHKAFFSRRTKGVGSFGQPIVVYEVKPASWKNRDNPEWWNPVSLDVALCNGYIKATGPDKKQFSLSHSDIIRFKES